MTTIANRNRVFWLLKKYSSHTSWHDLADAYDQFYKQWQIAMESADSNEIDEFNNNATKVILDGKIAFEKSLGDLRKGYHNGFRFSEKTGFKVACSAIEYIDIIMNPDEYVFDWMKNKNNVESANAALQKKYTESLGMRCLLEPKKRVDSVAPFHWQNIFASHFEPFNFPTELPDAPTGRVENVVSNAEVTITGVWEPILLDEQFGERTIGCLNYFVSGRSAPLYQLNEPLPVTWRLIWEDHRYEDGTIPEEEKYYLAKPEPEEKAALKALPGDICPKSGLWVVRHHDHTQRHFKQGEVFPELNLPNAATIWRFVKE